MAVVHAYLNDGFLVITLLTGAVGVGGILTLHIATGVHPIMAPVTPLEALAVTLEFVGLGLAAFVIGAGTRRFVTHIR